MKAPEANAPPEPYVRGTSDGPQARRRRRVRATAAEPNRARPAVPGSRTTPTETPPAIEGRLVARGADEGVVVAGGGVGHHRVPAGDAVHVAGRVDERVVALEPGVDREEVGRRLHGRRAREKAGGGETAHLEQFRLQLHLRLP